MERTLRLHHLRNATARLDIGPHRLVLDPMLAEPGALPGFRLVGGARRRNPLVPLPPGAATLLDEATGVLITHEHPDHLDRAGRAWIRDRALPVWASRIDVPNLRRRGLDARPIEDGVLDVAVEVVPTRHGRGWLGWLMGPVSGLYLAPRDGPSLLITSDAVLTEALLAAVARLRPDVIVAPAGSANMGVGGDILFSVEELCTLARQAPGVVVFNHLEALDHCPTRRDELRDRLAEEGLLERARIPEDGEVLTLGAAGARPVAPEPGPARAPGLQKWVSARLAGA